MNRCGTHAVVLGASMAGLVHAVPLAERFDRVTIVDRDSRPTAADGRRGISQGHHVHLLLPGGVARLEQLFPAMVADLTDRGAHVIPAREWRFCLGGGHLDVSGSGGDLTSGSHLARPDIDAPRPLSWRLTNSYLSRLVPTAHHDPAVAAALIRVLGMLDRPSALMHPQTLRRSGFPVKRRRRPQSVPGPPIAA